MLYNQSMSSKKTGFTLLEMLIVIGILGIIGATVLILMNPWQQVGKAKDTQRKHDLDTLKKTLEDWYNDKGCYPRADEICAPSTVENVCAVGNKIARSKVCKICGKATGSPSSSPYLDSWPCDPEYPSKFYLYQVETPGCTGVSNCSNSSCPVNYCPSWYRIYTDFSSVTDADSYNIGCMGGGCGLSENDAVATAPTPQPYGYDYGISSPNKNLEYSISFSCVIRGICNGCGGKGDYNACVTNPNCDKDKIFATGAECIANNGR